ncbi:pseudouridine synthase [Thalassotalea fusca]
MHTSLLPPCFTPFAKSVSNIELPSKFTYPFCYQPSEIVQQAVKELQYELCAHVNGVSSEQGRMFGVLVVKTANGQLGYLTAISGATSSLSQWNHLPLKIVPAIFEGFSPEHEYFQKQKKINAITEEITQLELSPTLSELSKLLEDLRAQAHLAISEKQQVMRNNKKLRKQQREILANAQVAQSLSAATIRQQSIQLSRESVQDKKALAQLKAHWHQHVLETEIQYQTLIKDIEQLKKARRKLSSGLQKLLFKQYQLLNIKGESADLLALFKNTTITTPPAGTGDCAAPKLLQYAFEHRLTPISMAEFWWGSSPQSEIRKHGLYYPACQGKCQPILEHMLSGMVIDENPMLNNPAENSDLAIVYQDEDIVVVNKPAGLLSVPGKNITDSVATRVRQRFPHATGPMIVHRLDMATSGLLILSLNERAHKGLQKQFIDKEITKHYVAVVDGNIIEASGTITLPLRGDLNDRPRQLVCLEHGKPARTEWKLIARENGKSRLQLFPVTGRTHQLRVHCAHPNGLNTAIVGDDLYGSSGSRLHLHAQRLALKHPVSKQPIEFVVDADF